MSKKLQIILLIFLILSLIFTSFYIRDFRIDASSDSLVSQNDEDFNNELIEKYPNLIIVSNQPSSLKNIITSIKNNHNLFLVDPNGNVILGYDENFNGKKLLKDIKKLLKLSKIG